MRDAEMLVFHRGGYRFAVPVENVRRVAPVEAAQPVPGAAPGVRGMIESGGRVHTLVRSCLPEPTKAAGQWRRWLLLSGSVSYGIEVDSVEGIRPAHRKGDEDLPEDDIPGASWEAVITHPVEAGGSSAWVLDVDGLVRDHTEGG